MVLLPFFAPCHARAACQAQGAGNTEKSAPAGAGCRGRQKGHIGHVRTGTKKGPAGPENHGAEKFGNRESRKRSGRLLPVSGAAVDAHGCQGQGKEVHAMEEEGHTQGL